MIFRLTLSQSRGRWLGKDGKTRGSKRCGQGPAIYYLRRKNGRDYKFFWIDIEEGDTQP